MHLSELINLENYPVSSDVFANECRAKFDRDGLIILQGFLSDKAISTIYQEGIENQKFAYFCETEHNVYLDEQDLKFDHDHPRNKKVKSSKGCIADDQIPDNSVLRSLYESTDIKKFLAHVLSEKELYPYADKLSPINLHYAKTGQELGWHFDNSSFAITLMVQPACEGGEFEYVRNVRDADKGDMSFDATNDVLTGKTEVNTLAQSAGDLVLFRGRNAIHRVTPNLGKTTRMLVVLAYNSEPGIAISDTAARTFYGRQ